MAKKPNFTRDGDENPSTHTHTQAQQTKKKIFFDASEAVIIIGYRSSNQIHR